MKRSDSHEQREFERIPQKVNISLTPQKDQGLFDGHESTCTENISEKGICVCVPTRHETGTSLSLQIDLEGWQRYLRTVLSLPEDGAPIHPLTARGEVVWSHELPAGSGYQVGIQFTDFDEEQFSAYTKYLHIIRETVR